MSLPTNSVRQTHHTIKGFPFRLSAIEARVPIQEVLGAEKGTHKGCPHDSSPRTT